MINDYNNHITNLRHCLKVIVQKLFLVKGTIVLLFFHDIFDQNWSDIMANVVKL